MKYLILAALVCRLVLTACAAKTITLPQLPDGTLPDTEVTTNIPLRVNAERLDVFSLKLQIEGTGAASEVLVAVGHDADQDGELSFEETAFVFGNDCGERYLVNHQMGRVFTGMVDTVAINHRDFDPTWNLAKIVKRGEGAVGETITEVIENKRFSIRIR
ncbi:MAG: hypothetical protein IKJ45_03010 [Kiritimatiellae bacterium]|nr:hypothetical protein [Kiritimatiellia bacterium]